MQFFLYNDGDEMRVLRRVVYIMKSSGPRTEPWGHHKAKCVRKRSSRYILHRRCELR